MDIYLRLKIGNKDRQKGLDRTGRKKNLRGVL